MVPNTLHKLGATSIAPNIDRTQISYEEEGT